MRSATGSTVAWSPGPTGFVIASPLERSSRSDVSNGEGLSGSAEQGRLRIGPQPVRSDVSDGLIELGVVNVHHDGKRGRPWIGPNALQDRQTIQLGQLDVEEHQSGSETGIALGEGTLAEEVVERSLPISYVVDLDAGAFAAEAPEGELGVARIVFDEEDGGFSVQG